MQIHISGQHINLGDSLRSYVEERLSKSINKYFEKVISASVDFVKESYNYKATITAHESTGFGLHIRSDGESDDIYTAFDIALMKIEKQLRKYKQKIKNHHKKAIHELTPKEKNLLNGMKYVISTAPKNEEDDEDNPIIIAEKPQEIPKLTVAEAVMRMDLANLPALLFTNKANDRINVVYYRKDGNISWVDSGTSSQPQNTI